VNETALYQGHFARFVTEKGIPAHGKTNPAASSLSQTASDPQVVEAVVWKAGVTTKRVDVEVSRAQGLLVKINSNCNQLLNTLGASLFTTGIKYLLFVMRA